MAARPDASQRVLDEIKRTVWPIDQKFFRDNPGRNYWLRQALPIEVAYGEFLAGAPAQAPPGAVTVVAIRQVKPGERLYEFVLAEGPPGPFPSDLPEDVCRTWYRGLRVPAVALVTLTFSSAEPGQ